MARQAKIGAEWIHSRRRRYGIEIPAAVGAIVLMGPQAGVAAIRLGIHLREWPFFTQEREGIVHYKLKTIPTAASAQLLLTMGTEDPRTSDFCNKIRRRSIDESPQLFKVLSGNMALWGIRGLWEVDHERYRQANPVLYREWFEEKNDLHIKPALAGPSALWRKGRVDSLTPEACMMSMLLDQEHMRAETRQTELAGYRSLPDIIRGRSQWAVPPAVQERFEAITQLPRTAITP